MSKYIITKVKHKRSTVNPWHERVVGKRCVIESLNWLGSAVLLVEDAVQHSYGDMPMRYTTSPVRKTKEKNGVLTIETENSVYTLELGVNA